MAHRRRSRSRSPLLRIRPIIDPSVYYDGPEYGEEDLRDELRERRFRDSERAVHLQTSYYYERHQMLEQFTNEHNFLHSDDESIVINYKEENIDLHKKLGEANAKLLEEYNRHLEELSDKESSSLKQEKDHRRDVKFFKDKIDEYRKNEEQMQQKISKNKIEKGQLETRVKELFSIIEEIKNDENSENKHKHVNPSTNEFSASHDDLKKEISDKDDLIANLESTICNLSKDVESLTSQRENDIKKLNTENADLKKQLELTKANNSALEKETPNLESESETTKTEVDELKKKMNEIANENIELKEKLKSLNEDIEKSTLNHKLQITSLEAEKETLNAALEDETKKNSRLQKSISENHESCANDQPIQNTPESQNQSTDCNDFQRRISILESDKKEMTEKVKQYDELKAQSDAFEVMMSNAKTQYDDLNKLIQEKDKEIEKVSKDFLIKEEKLLKFTTQIDTLVSELSENKQQLSKFTKQLDIAISDKLAYQKKYEDLSEEASKKEKVLWEELKKCREDQTKIKELESHRNDLEERNRMDRKELSKQVDDSQNYIKQILKLKKEKSDLHEIAQFSADNIKTLQSENSELKTKLSELEQALETFRNQVKEKSEVKNYEEILRLNELVSEKDNEIFAIMSEKSNLVREIEKLRSRSHVNY